MFVDHVDMEQNCLRQGDILEKVPFPLLNLTTTPILGQFQPNESGLEQPTIKVKLHEHK